MAVPEYPPPAGDERVPSPSLQAVHDVARILKAHAATGPLGIEDIAGRTAHHLDVAAVEACVAELETLGFVTVGHLGVLWTQPEEKPPNVDDRFALVEGGG